MKPRYVLADTHIAQDFGVPHIVVLSDIGFWTSRYEDLIAWCKDHNADVQGTTVNIRDNQTLTAFCLKWS